MKYSFFILLIVFQTHVFSQLKQMYPELGITPDLSFEKQQKQKLYDDLAERYGRGEITWEDMTEKEQDIFGEFELQGVWDVIGNGDNWYDMGGPYNVTASSHLAAYNNIIYTGEMAHDHSYKTAWVEGKSDDGIGEYLTYYFENESPRVTEVIVVNGYVKSDKAWKANSRVKQLKMYINDIPFAFLNLKDTKTEQIFRFEPLGRTADGKDLILKFEITKVYKGEKYSDTALTELYFQGADVY